MRQTSLATIETRGAYYSHESHSPLEGDLVDAAEETIKNLSAKTCRGVFAKAWVSLARTGDGFSEEGMVQGDIFRRADFDEVRAMMEAGELDFHQDLLVSAIGGLLAILA